MDSQKKTSGLAGIVAGDTSLCLCKDESDLLYRGYRIQDLASKCSFEEVTWLLWHEDLPNSSELEGFKNDLFRLRILPPSLKHILQELPPTTNLMDVLRSAVSILGHLYPEEEETDPFLTAERTFASLPGMLLYWYHFHTSGKMIDLEQDAHSFAAFILELIDDKEPDPLHVAALNVSLILYAEHEFNASTFAVRTITSTLSDYYSAICGGIGALRGPLHGGANEVALDLILSCLSEEDAEKKVLEKLSKKELVMGFGHRVYTKDDPRSHIIENQAERLATSTEKRKLLSIARHIEHVMHKEKGFFPNLDFYSSLVYHFMGIAKHFYTPLFAMARVAGWTAHVFEQRKYNKIIRPVARYIGFKERPILPIKDRP